MQSGGTFTVIASRVSDVVGLTGDGLVLSVEGGDLTFDVLTPEFGAGVGTSIYLRVQDDRLGTSLTLTAIASIRRSSTYGSFAWTVPTQKLTVSRNDGGSASFTGGPDSGRLYLTEGETAVFEIVISTTFNAIIV